MLSMGIKMVLRFSISLIFLLHLLLVYMKTVSWESGLWAFVMQGLYHRLISDHPNIDVRSPIFVFVCG